MLWILLIHHQVILQLLCRIDVCQGMVILPLVLGCLCVLVLLYASIHCIV
jgi:hypothetical protein